MRKSVTTIIMMVLFAATAAQATIHRVPQDFAKIQSAINAAANGDTVLVAEGTYMVNLIINTKITLASLFIMDGDTSHISRTVLYGGSPSHPDTGSVINIQPGCDTNTVIKGLTITKGTGSKIFASNNYWLMGGGLCVRSTGVTVRNNRIVANTTVGTSSLPRTLGGGMAIWPWEPQNNYWIIEDNIFLNNASVGYSRGTSGGAISVSGSGRMLRNSFHGNSATMNPVNTSHSTSGGAVELWTGTVQSAVVLMDRNRFTGNSAIWGSAIVISHNSTVAYNYPVVTFQNNIVAGNQALAPTPNIEHVHGPIHLIKTTANFINNTIVHNTGNYAVYIGTVPNTIRLLNTVVWNPAVGTQFRFAAGTPTSVLTANNNCVFGGISGIANITADPKFAAGDTLYRLHSASPCIGAGVPSASLAGLSLAAPVWDFNGALRPHPSWSRCDLGAVESPFALPDHPAVLRVPQEYATVQSAINAAKDSDLVLVSEGTYAENLVIKKKITLASLYLYDGDTSHISRTILDGGSPAVADSASVILISAGTDSTTQITGFTVRNGRGTRYLFGTVHWRAGLGINISAGSARITHNIITDNSINSRDALFGGGICVYGSSLEYWIIEHNHIIRNQLTTSISNVFAGASGGGLSVTGNGRICNNILYDNAAMHIGTGSSVYGSAGGIDIFAEVLPTSILISRNQIRKNSSSRWAAGIYAGRYLGIPLTVSLIDNIISGNTCLQYGTALVLSSGECTMVNNTITDNAGPYGIYVETLTGRGTATMRMLNNILWNTGTVSELVKGSGSYSFTRYSDNNLVRGGISGTDNISGDPLFVISDTLYRLQNASPALSAGISHALVGGIDLYAPKQDYLGAVRPRPALMRPDLGAIEHDSGSVKDPSDVKELSGLDIPTSFMLAQNYPNPFNPSTTIRYALPKSSWVKLVVYDLLGREISVLANEMQSAGWKEVKWTASGFSSGMYFYTLSSDGFRETRSMVIVK